MLTVRYLNPSAVTVLESTVRLSLGELCITENGTNFHFFPEEAKELEVNFLTKKLVNLSDVFVFYCLMGSKSFTVKELESASSLWEHLQYIAERPEVMEAVANADSRGVAVTDTVEVESPQRVIKRWDSQGVRVEKYCPTCNETVKQNVMFQFSVDGRQYPTEYYCPNCDADLAQVDRAFIEKARSAGKIVEGMFTTTKPL